MQKVVKFLEQNVQWLALGLGGLFFVWMVWGYVITPPAVAAVGSEQLGPGEVDQKVQERGGDPLVLAMQSKEPDPNIPKTPKDSVGDFVAVMSNNGAPSATLAKTDFYAPVYTPDANDQPQNPRLPRLPNQPQNNNPALANGQQGKITGLPTLPVAEIIGAGGGLSSITPPANAQGAVAVIPAAAGGAAPNGQPLPLDKAWATATFRLPTPEIAKSFAAVQVPQGTKSLVLQIEMVREQQLPNGAWGPETPVRKIAIPGEVPYPSGGAKGLEFAYRQWAEQHESDILEPQFYTVVGGTPWLPPGLPQVAQNAPAAATFDPNNYTGPLDKLTPEQKQAVFKVRQQKAIDKAKNAPKQAPRGNPGGSPFGPRGPGGPGNETGMLPSTEVYFAPPPGPNRFVPPPGPNRYVPTQFGATPEDMGDNQNAYGGSSAPPPPGLTPEAQQMVQKHPTSSFDPADPNLMGGIIVWAHDDNVEAGKTYRYRMRYKMLNPGYVQPGLFVNGKLALTFDVISEWTPWTTAVDVPAQTTFFVSRNPLTNGVPLDVYHWQNGQLRSKSLTVPVGDMIGGPDGDTDYTTGWTVADIRSDPRGGTYVLLMDNSGKTVRRDFATDQKDPKYLDFKAQITSQKPPTNGAPGGPFGGPGYGAAGGG